jgi:hypothetical protein
MINKLNNMFYVFIWQGNVKIKNTVTVKGGLKMFNLNDFIMALKISLFKRMISDACWKNIIINEIDMQKLFHCRKHYIDKIAKSISKFFWKDTFNALSTYIDKYSINNESFAELPLFYNSKLLIGNTSVFLNSWFKAGVA